MPKTWLDVARDARGAANTLLVEGLYRLKHLAGLRSVRGIPCFQLGRDLLFHCIR